MIRLGRKFLIGGALLILCSALSFAQESDAVLKAFQKNFVQASLSIKLQVIKDAANVGNVNMGPLYLQAVDFVINNANLLETDSLARELATLSIRLIGETKYKEARYAIWKLFSIYKETTVRVAIMNTLGETAFGDAKLIEELNTWLRTQNNIVRTGQTPDHQVVASCIESLGKLGDPSSFPIIFTSMVLKYSDAISKVSQEALNNIQGDFKELLIGVIKRNTILEKLAALRLSLENSKLSDDNKGEIAQVALGVALEAAVNTAEERAMIRDMRYESIRAITARKWAAATSLAIEHLNRTIFEYDRGVGTKSNLLEAIACLGAMGTNEAAVRLTGYLQLINSYTENNQPYDEQIVLAVINNLKILGDKIAFDDLLYTPYLGYSDTVKKAAREAVNNLKW